MKKLLIFGLAGGAAASLAWIMVHYFTYGEITWAGVVFGVVFLGIYLALGIITAVARKRRR